MNDRQLRSFVLAAEEGSFSKAAAASYISTPAFVQQVNLLEKDVGFALFERTRRGVSLTEAGEQFLVAARKILETYDASVARGREMERAAGLVLRIAHPTDTLPRPLQLAYQQFVAARPEVMVSFERKPLVEHFDAIRNGTADVTLIGEPTEEALGGLRFVPLADETYSFCMRPGHALSLRRSLTKKDLRGAHVLDGHYTYLKVRFADLLPEEASLSELDRAYDMAVRARVMGSDEMFVILSRWASQYEGSLRVVPSRIKAGRIGVVVRDEASPLIDEFVAYLRGNIDER